MQKNKITLRDFLIRFTPISKTFIDKYLSFLEMCKNDPFGINIIDVVDYLDIKSFKKFKERIIHNFTENFDYKKQRNNIKNTKDTITVEYHITFNTFQKLCMLSKTKRGNEVRDYHVTLHNFIDYYKNDISEAIIKNIINGKGYIYIILVNKNKNIFKIGRSKDLRKRLSAYMSGKEKIPDIKFIMTVNDPLTIENCSKSLLKKFKFKENQEIYKIDMDLIKPIIFNCAQSSKLLEGNIDMNKVESYIVYDSGK